MLKTCYNCGYIRKPSDINSIEECPKCGAYYKKYQTSQPQEFNQNLKSEKEGSGKYSLTSALLLDCQEWCVGRIWVVRIPVLLYLLYLLIRKIYDKHCYTLFDGINLGIHEMGHPLFRVLGEFMGVAGGTILQCMAPLLAMVVLAKQKDYFGISFCLSWLAVNFIGISIYMSDAMDLDLDLVTIGGTSEPVPKEDMHDWHILFSKLGLLTHDKAIGSFTYWVGILLLFVSIGIGSILVYWMIKLKKQKL